MNTTYFRHIPNVITVVRLLLVPLLVNLMLQQRYTGALLLMVLMGVSDAVDGFLAKHYNWRSVLGAYLDPLADKTMLIATYITLSWQALLPLWLVVAVVLRDAVILLGAFVYHMLTNKLEMEPSIASKVNTFFQIVLVLAVILGQLTAIPGWLLAALIGLTLLATLYSGIGYVIEWAKRAHKELNVESH